ncbi:MAG: peptidylprolyl isomerase [Alphaproteobacteria bacterium]|nr:peptidylprolyl isomerase [Alphaproteobacteria bacterium]
MRRFLSAVLILAAFMLIPVTPARAGGEGIALVVNEDAVSLSDLKDRMHLVMASSGLPDTPDIREKLTPQIAGALIEEQLKMQEAKRLNITVTPEEVDQGFAALSAQNKFTPDQFKSLLKKGGINIATMQRQIRAQIAWSKVVQDELRPKITVTDSDIENVLQRLQANKGQIEYLLAEIFLPIENAKDEQSIQQLAQRLHTQIKSGQAPFFKIAQQFSKTAGASKGGDMGWVQQSQLPPELASALTGMAKESLTDPVRSLSGYHIMLVRDIRTIADDTIPPREEIVSGIGMERLERLQRRLLMDLKSAAFIENRVES